VNEHDEKEQNASEGREIAHQWMSAASVVLFFISTTVFDAQILVAHGPKLMIAFVLGLIYMQGYALWYYFKRVRSAGKKMLIAEAYRQLFAMAMVGTSVIAIVGVYAIRLLLHHG
jgi:hypothetical protein